MLKTDRQPFQYFLSTLRSRFSIDIRALAAFRIGIGALLILDTFLRWRNLTAFYTDVGVLPRSAAVFDSMPYSLHTIMGTPFTVKVVFISTILVGAAIMVGYHSKIAMLTGWMLTYSIHSRNPFVLAGADTLFYLLILWGMFLPLGAKWAIKPTPSEDNRSTVFTGATIGILLQVWIVYIVSGIHKIRGPEWMAGEAVNQIFQVDQIIILLGSWIADMGFLLTTINYVWLALLIASPLMIITSKWIRTIFVTLLIGGHVMMFLTIKLGLFPLVTILGLLVFYPPFVWDFAENAFRNNTSIKTVENG